MVSANRFQSVKCKVRLTFLVYSTVQYVQNIKKLVPHEMFTRPKHGHFFKIVMNLSTILNCRIDAARHKLFPIRIRNTAAALYSTGINQNGTANILLVIVELYECTCTDVKIYMLLVFFQSPLPPPPGKWSNLFIHLHPPRELLRLQAGWETPSLAVLHSSKYWRIFIML